MTQIRYQVKNEPISGGKGHGCSISQHLERDKTSLGAKGGLFFQLAFSQHSSLVFGTEILFTESEKNILQVLNV
ncbi:MAG: hypothetical protein IPM42_17340 [Saprospiraceae bacterium]|nr:hypothetical protein [Saprospiraceae bacterium]